VGTLLWLAFALALAGAMLNGLGALWQNTAVRDKQNGKLVQLGALLTLLRNPRWLMGQLAVIVGSLLHFGALAFAPVTVIQPIGVLAVAVTTLASARREHTRLNAGAWLSLAAVVLGVGGFTSLAATNAQVTSVSDATAVLIAVIVGLLLMVLGLIGSVGHGVVRCLAFAAGGGVVFGFASVVVRLAALSLEHGNLAEGAKTSTVATVSEVACFLLAAAGIVLLSKLQHLKTTGTRQQERESPREREESPSRGR
jgi:hypothetical protein